MYYRTLNEAIAIFSIRICIPECCCYRIVPFRSLNDDVPSTLIFM